MGPLGGIIGPSWRLLSRRWLHNGPTMAPRWLQDGPKTAPSRPQGASNNHRMLTSFGITAKSPPKGPQDPPKRPPEPPKGPSGPPRRLPRPSQEALWRPSGGPRDPPRRFQDASLCRARFGALQSALVRLACAVSRGALQAASSFLCFLGRLGRRPLALLELCLARALVGA